MKKQYSVEISEPESVWCNHRKRFIPVSLKGTKPPSPVDGPDWVDRKEEEDILLANFDAEVAERRKHFRLDAQGLLDPHAADKRIR